MTEELNPVVEPYEVDPYHKAQDDFDQRQVEETTDDNAVENVENSEMKAQGEKEPVDERQQAFDNWTHKIPVVGSLKWGLDSAALGVGDFIFDAVGLVPWLKPADEWWDNNSPRASHPAHKIIRDSSSVIIPSLVGGMGLVGWGTKATKAMTLPGYVKTLGTVGAYTGADTAVAMISSHSKTDDNLAASLNNWLGWGLPWATRDGDSPDVRWKKNVYESAGLAGGVELVGAAFAFAKKAKLFPRDAQAEELINAKKVQLSQYDNALSADVDSSIAARKAAQNDEMIDALKADPSGQDGYNAFINDLGDDAAGKAVVNTQPDPMMAKLHQTQIQGNIGTLNAVSYTHLRAHET